MQIQDCINLNSTGVYINLPFVLKIENIFYWLETDKRNLASCERISLFAVLINKV